MLDILAIALSVSLVCLAFLLILAWHERRYAREREEWKQERAKRENYHSAQVLRILADAKADREGLLNRIQRPETLGQAPADRKPRQPWSDQREADIARKQEEANGRPLR